MWKDVIGYDWLYQVNNKWLVRSLKFWKVIVLKWSISKCWHSYINLYLKWIKFPTSNHRLVALHFIPNPLNLPCVLHKDETLIDWILYNWEDNLYWGTHQDNMKDCFRKWRANNHLQLNNPNKWKFWKQHHWSKSITQYSLEWEFIKEWYCVKDIERELWIFNSNISSCCNWKRKTSWWFIWKFK